MVSDSIRSRVQRADFPRAAAYDPEWVLEHEMGPNALWLMEALTNEIELSSGMRVLDLGCGKALTSIFLAREFGVRVVAHDYWISASDNWSRIREAAVEDQVMPVHAEAHRLPFADGYFDAVVSVDAFHYFGTDDLFLERITRLLRPGGQLGIVVPGLRDDLDELPPPGLADHWAWDMASFHSPEWWSRHWAKSGKVEITRSEWLAHGHELWLEWDDLVTEFRSTSDGATRPTDQGLLRADTEQLLGFALVCAVIPD